MPPIRNSARKPTQNNSGVLNSIVPCHRVPIQLSIFTPVGIAIRNELSITNTRIASGSGVVNVEAAIAL
jgi:hypothetical protein